MRKIDFIIHNWMYMVTDNATECIVLAYIFYILHANNKPCVIPSKDIAIIAGVTPDRVNSITRKLAGMRLFKRTNNKNVITYEEEDTYYLEQHILNASIKSQLEGQQ